MKIKNPFKKQGIAATAVNTLIGGAGNVAFDYAWDALGDTTSSVSENWKNGIKIVGGAVLGSMVTNKYLRAMADGFAVVGASNLVSDLISKEAPAGLPHGTVGRIIPGNRTYRKMGIRGDFVAAD